MRDYPSITLLAKAHQDQVLKSWEGLGYYSRARNLHSGSRFVMEEFGGNLPKTVEELLKIPGIGPYTAAAISSLAFGMATPLIDGNVLRVFARVTRLKSDITRTSTRTGVQAELGKLIPGDDPAAFNQGLMDLGRVICLPRSPDCPMCPLNQVCQAWKAKDVAKYPVKPNSKKIPHYHIAIGLIRRGGDFLIQKRPENGLLGGLWEFPGGKIEADESGEAALLREIKEETGLDVKPGEKIGTIQHAYTHFKITLTAWFCDWTQGEAQTNAATENRWVSLEELENYAFPGANRKILELIS